MRFYSTEEKAIVDLEAAARCMGEFYHYAVEKAHTFTQGTNYAVACYSSQGNFLGYF